MSLYVAICLTVSESVAFSQGKLYRRSRIQNAMAFLKVANIWFPMELFDLVYNFAGRKARIIK
jgi:hypothetical protein